tara:strand:- start:430 stop:636 length:207 start_codon:yes stop_codon:yes gene_type:complete
MEHAMNNSSEILSQFVRIEMFSHNILLSFEATVTAIENKLQPQMCRDSLSKEILPIYNDWIKHYALHL